MEPTDIIWNTPRPALYPPALRDPGVRNRVPSKMPVTSSQNPAAFQGPVTIQRAAVSSQGSGADGPATDDTFKPFGDDGLTFADLLDIINPLQHIPIISTLYRHLTGDEIDPAPRIAGGALFGGPIGAGAALVNVMIESATGMDVGEHFIALLDDVTADDPLPSDANQIAGGATNASQTPDIAWNTDIVWNGPRALTLVDHQISSLAATPQGLSAQQSIQWNTPRPPGVFDVSPQTIESAQKFAPSRPPEKKRYDIATTLPGPVANPRPVAGMIKPLDDGERKVAPGAAGASIPQSGSISSDGGWFAANMISALNQYQQANDRTRIPGTGPLVPSTRLQPSQ